MIGLNVIGVIVDKVHVRAALRRKLAAVLVAWRAGGAGGIQSSEHRGMPGQRAARAGGASGVLLWIEQ